MSDEVAMPEANEIDAAWRAWQTERTRRVTQLRHDARAVWRSMEGWQRVETEEDWLRTVEKGAEASRSGRFLIERLGAERFLDPELMAVLWELRQGLLAEGTGTAAERMLVDLTVVGWYNALRVQGWIGDLALGVEHEFFGEEGPGARFDRRHGRAAGLVVEERLARLGEQLLPLLDRSNRLVVRNLKALAELRRGPAPTVAIGRAEQVNVATQQVNAVVEARLMDGPVPSLPADRAGRQEA